MLHIPLLQENKTQKVKAISRLCMRLPVQYPPDFRHRDSKASKIVKLLNTLFITVLRSCLSSTEELN